MRMNALTFAVLLCFSVYGVSCCSDGQKPNNSTKSGPVFDRELGLLEKDVLKKYGEPKEAHTTAAKELKSELRAALKSKVASEDVMVKELYYKLDKKERMFWLIYQEENWRVISDVEIPEGVFF